MLPPWRGFKHLLLGQCEVNFLDDFERTEKSPVFVGDRIRLAKEGWVGLPPALRDSAGRLRALLS